MTSKLDTTDDLTAWVAPTEHDIRGWEALSREEQVRQLRKLFESAECNSLSRRSFGEIMAEARARAASRLDG